MRQTRFGADSKRRRRVTSVSDMSLTRMGKIRRHKHKKLRVNDLTEAEIGPCPLNLVVTPVPQTSALDHDQSFVAHETKPDFFVR